MAGAPRCLLHATIKRAARSALRTFADGFLWMDSPRFRSCVIFDFIEPREWSPGPTQFFTSDAVFPKSFMSASPADVPRSLANPVHKH